jgi:spore coat polysaccharide biosynthesis predicted glycosyltransferase SpsG
LRDWIKEVFKRETPHTVLFRVDAGRLAGLSFGHAVRCLVLARVIGEVYGSISLFLMRDMVEGLRYVEEAGFSTLRLPVDIATCREGEQLEAAINARHCNWLVVDLPYRVFDTEGYPAIRRGGTRILFIDDNRRWCPDADVYLNSSLSATQPKLVGKTTDIEFFLGPRYLIFDDTGIQTNPFGRTAPPNVLVTFGGSDPAGMTIRVVECLLQHPWNGVRFHVVTGPGYADAGRIAARIRRRIDTFRHIHHPPDLLPYLKHCDLAICSAGRTGYELMHMNKKFIPVATAVHEQENVDGFIRAGAARFGFHDLDTERLIEAVRTETL